MDVFAEFASASGASVAEDALDGAMDTVDAIESEEEGGGGAVDEGAPHALATLLGVGGALGED